jgi:hypothetical protein
MKSCCTKIVGILFLAVMFWGCPSGSRKDENEITRKPEIVLRIASLNFDNYHKRIEQRALTALAKVLKHEQVDVFAVQGISRYPGVASRIDFIDELSRITEWRNAFGEMMNVSGHQTGNAVFSSYPILSFQNQPFDHLKKGRFDASLQATIDAGVRSLAIVSVHLPSQAAAEEETRCLRLITALIPDGKTQTTIITGNLPASEAIRVSSLLTEVRQSKSHSSTIPRIWYSANSSFQLLSSHTVETEFGKLVIAQFGLFQQK